MKKIFFTAAIIFGCLTVKQADAQLRLNLGVNIGSQPDWGPTGYDHADYYYMPDIDAYYDVPGHQYVYLDNNVWVHNRALPPRYSNFDRYHSYKVVVNQRNPWEHQGAIRAKYAGFRGRHDQGLIRDSHDAHYRNHYHEDGGHGGGGHQDHGDHGHRN
jgi:hypothetical protein